MTKEKVSVTQLDEFQFTSENMNLVNFHIKKYPKGRQASAVMPLLNMAQKQCKGWLPRSAMEHVAEILDMPPIKVFEVATFYTMYNLEPVGEFHIQLCRTLPCWLRGSEGILSACQTKLGIKVGQTTKDGKFTLSEVVCLGACVNAPMMQINDDYYEDLDEASTKSILTELAQGVLPKVGSQISRTSCEPVGGLTALKNVRTTKSRIS